MNTRYRLPVQFGAIVLIAVALYGPFLANPLVFDDRVFFAGQSLANGFAYFATTPLGLDLRVPSYFTLAFTEVATGRIEAHRVISLVLHVACAGVLYALLRRLLGRESLLPLAGALIFLVHPMAVYGAGYLVQRSIVLATLFSLLSVVLFVRGLDRGSHADAFSAAVMYSLAVLSKEHAILLPAVAVLALALSAAERRFALRHAALYLLACAPAALFVVMKMKGIIGTPYEAEAARMASQLDTAAGGATVASPWLASVLTQMGLFFKYLGLWLLPLTRWMSIDIHIDVAATASAAWSAFKSLAFLGFAAVALLCLRRGGRLAIIGLGLLYIWLQFLVELSSVRLQEPFVLYRSYLWAPGIVIAVMAALTFLPRRLAVTAALLCLPLLFVQAYDRLTSFSSPVALWEDAAAKVPLGVPGGQRPLFQLGRELLYSGNAERAIAVADQCITQYPKVPQCYLARGTILLELERYEEALPFFVRVSELDPTSGVAHHHRGVALEGLGDYRAALEEYALSAKLDFGGAKTRLRVLQERLQKGTLR